MIPLIVPLRAENRVLRAERQELARQLSAIDQRIAVNVDATKALENQIALKRLIASSISEQNFKFIKIKAPQHIFIMQLAVTQEGRGSENVAQGRPVTFNGKIQYGAAQNIVDGNLDLKRGTAAGFSLCNNTNPWLCVELLVAAPVTSVTILTCLNPDYSSYPISHSNVLELSIKDGIPGVDIPFSLATRIGPQNELYTFSFLVPSLVSSR